MTLKHRVKLFFANIGRTKRKIVTDHNISKEVERKREEKEYKRAVLGERIVDDSELVTIISEEIDNIREDHDSFDVKNSESLAARIVLQARITQLEWVLNKMYGKKSRN